METVAGPSIGAIIGFVLLTLLFIGILTALFTVGSVQEIAKNWPRYRCNPIFMPFASAFGSDPVENFQFCLDSVFAGKAAVVFGPLYAILNDFGNIISKIVNVAMGLRNLFKTMFESVTNFLSNVKQRIQTLILSARMSFLKMNQLMGRVFGTLYAIIFMGISALAAGQNIANNDIVQFLFEFCFHPLTPVRLSNGTTLPIKDVYVGGSLAPIQGVSPIVTSKFIFDGTRTPMVTIGPVEDTIHLSAQHYVGGKTAAEHPTAYPAPSIDRLVCLNVEGHQFHVGNYVDTEQVVSDYDESSTPNTVKKTQALAELRLNGRPSVPITEEHVLEVLADYSLGIDDRAPILMEDGSIKLLKHIQLGDCVQGGGTVLGLVEELVEHVVTHPDYPALLLSPSQLIWTKGSWLRAAVAYPDRIRDIRTILRQLFTERCSTFAIASDSDPLICREYREIADPDMEEEYAQELRE